MKRLFMAASAVALAFVLNSAARADEDKDPFLPIDAEKVQLSRVTLMPSGFPERATGVDAPIDMSVGNSTAQSMVNSGQVSPGAGAAGGIIAALLIAAVDAGVDDMRTDKIEAMLEAQSFDARAIFESALVEALVAGNLTTGVQKADRPKEGFFQLVANPDSPIDASIDIVIRQYGFTVDAPGWRPSVSVQVKVFEPRTGSLLMNEYLTYGRPGLRPPFPIPGEKPNAGSMAIVVPYDPSYSFETVDAYTKDEPERAVEALTTALEDVAVAVAKLVLTASPAIADMPAQQTAEAESGAQALPATAPEAP